MNARGGWSLLGACIATLIVGNTVSAAQGGAPAQGQGPAPAAGRGSAVEAQAPPALPWDEAPLAEHLFYEQAGAYRRDTLDVTVAPGPGLEVNLALKKGAVITYTWRVASPAASSIVSEFHGHTNRAPGEAGTLMFYRKANGSGEAGGLVAPFDGVHAWYFRNDSKSPVVIRLSVSGFYELQSKGSAVVSVP